MKVRMRCALAALCLMAAGQAGAETWRQAGSSDESLFFVDLDSIRRSGDAIKFTSMSVFTGTTDQRDFDKSVILRDARCAARSSQITEGYYYTGSNLLEHNSSPGRMITHNPDSVMANVVSTACGDRAYDSPVVGDPVAWARQKFRSGNW